MGWCCRQMTEAEGRRWWPSTMVKILSDPALVGKFYAYRTRRARGTKGERKLYLKPEEWHLVYEDPSQAILTPQGFYALQERFQRNCQNSRRNARHWYPPLRALIFCQCGRRMTSHTRKEQPPYRCARCGREVDAVRLWNQIREGLKEMLLSPERLAPAVKAQLDSGQSTAGLEEELRADRHRLDMLEQAEQKALRLHLYLPNYPAEKLEAELQRIGEQKQQLAQKRASLERQIAELRQAMVDEDGVRRFCQLASRNLDTLADGQWRMLLEAMRLKIMVSNEVKVKVALLAVKSEKEAIVLPISPRGRGGNLKSGGHPLRPPLGGVPPPDSPSGCRQRGTSEL